MKKKIFKFGAALTAALMICSATAGIAFADEVDETDPNTAPAVEETVDEAAPEETVDEGDVDDGDVDNVDDGDVNDVDDGEVTDEVVVPLETEPIEAEDIEAAEAEVEAAAKVDDVPTGSVITIGSIEVTADDTYYTVKVPFTVQDAPDQITLFVYDITAITGNQNNEVGFTADTPVGYINQYAATEGTAYEFKLDKTKYSAGDILIAKIGGTGVDVPDAKSFTLEASGETPEVKYGDVNGDSNYDTKDTLLVMQYGANKVTLTPEQIKAADVNLDGLYDTKDTLLIMQYGAHKVDSLPVPAK